MLITGSNSSLSDYLPGEVDPPRETFKVPTDTTEAMKRVYRTAVAPINEAPHIKHGFKAAPVEWLATLAARTVSIPFHMAGEILDLASKPINTYGESLIGGPRGETGEWTPEQMQTGIDAFNVAFLADVASIPGGGEGVANIVKKDALKSMAKSFKTETAELGPASWQKRAYRHFARSLRDVPQEVLDPIENVMVTTEERNPFRGQYGSIDREMKFWLGGAREEGGFVSPEIARNAVFHEVTHAEQSRPHLDVVKKLATYSRKDIRKAYNAGEIPKILLSPSRAIREAHAYEAGNLFEKYYDMTEGEKISYDKFREIYDLAKKKAVDVWGEEPEEYLMDSIVKESREEINQWRSARGKFDIDQKAAGLVEQVANTKSITLDALKAGEQLWKGELDPKVFERVKERYETAYESAKRKGDHNLAGEIAMRKQFFREAREMEKALRTGEGPPLIKEAAKKVRHRVMKELADVKKTKEPKKSLRELSRPIIGDPSKRPTARIQEPLMRIKKPLRGRPNKSNLGSLFKPFD